MSGFKKFFKNKGKGDKVHSKTTDESFLANIPPEKELGKMFELFLPELNLQEQKKNTMLQMTSENKWTFLCQHKSKEEIEKLREEANKQSPEFFVQRLEKQPNFETVSALSNSLNKNPYNWLADCLKFGVLSVLTQTFLKQSNKPTQSKTTNDYNIEFEYLKCFRSIVNTKVGLTKFFANSQNIECVVYCLENPKWQALSMSCELLSVFTIFPLNGQKYVLESFDKLEKKNNLKSRFSLLIKHLQQSINEPSSLEFKISCIMFINNLVNTPKDIRVRVELRKEFAVLGIRRIFNKFESEKYPALKTQITKFLEEWEIDENDIGEKIQDIPQRNEEDPYDVFKYLSANMVKSDYKKEFLSVLNKFCDASYDSNLNIWGTLDVVSSRIINEITSSQNNLNNTNDLKNNKINENIKELEKYILKQKEEINEFDVSIGNIIVASNEKMQEFIQKIESNKKKIYELKEMKDHQAISQPEENENKIEIMKINKDEEKINLLNKQIDLLSTEQEVIINSQQNENNKIKENKNTQQYKNELQSKIKDYNEQIETNKKTIENLQNDAKTYQGTIMKINEGYKILTEDFEDMEDEMFELIETGQYIEPNIEEINKTEEENINNLKSEITNLLNDIKNLDEELESVKNQLHEKLNQNNLNNEQNNLKGNKYQNNNNNNMEIKKEEEENNNDDDDDDENTKEKKLKIKTLLNEIESINQVILNTKKKFNNKIEELNSEIMLKQIGNQYLIEKWQKEKERQLFNNENHIKDIKQKFEKDRIIYLSRLVKLTNKLANEKIDLINYEKSLKLLKENYEKEINELKSNNSTNILNEKEIKLNTLECEKEYYLKIINELNDQMNSHKMISEKKTENLRKELNKLENNCQNNKRQIMEMQKQALELNEDSNAYDSAIDQIRQVFELEILDLQTELELTNIRINENKPLPNNIEGEGLDGNETEFLMVETNILLNKLEKENTSYEKIILQLQDKIDTCGKKKQMLLNENKNLLSSIEKLKSNENKINSSLYKKISNLKNQISNLIFVSILNNKDKQNIDNYFTQLMPNLEKEIEDLTFELSKIKTKNKIHSQFYNEEFAKNFKKIQENLNLFKDQANELINKIGNERIELIDKLFLFQQDFDQNLNDNNFDPQLLQQNYETRIQLLTFELEGYLELYNSNEREINEIKKNFEEQLLKVTKIYCNPNDLYLSGILHQQKEFEKIIQNLERENKKLKIKVRQERPELTEEQQLTAELFDNNFNNKILTKFIKNSKQGKLNTAPKKKMKSLHWDKLNQTRIEETIWSQISDESIELNIDELEDRFKLMNFNIMHHQEEGSDDDELDEIVKAQENEEDIKIEIEKEVNQDNENENKKGNQKEDNDDDDDDGDDNDDDEKENKNVIITILNPERTKNIALMLSKIKYSPNQIKNSILQLDDKILTVNNLRDLLKNAPTLYELNSLEEFKGITPTKIGKAELFYLEIMDIPRYANRIRSWICFRTFDEMKEIITKMTENVVSACKELQESQLFGEILKNILSMGNYLNSGTFKGGASGFKLNSLPKLSKMKSNNSEECPSLLHFLANSLKEKNSQICNLIKEIPHVREASTSSNQLIKNEMDQLSKGLKTIHLEIQNSATTDIEGKNFKEKMADFLIRANQEFKVLTEKINNMETIFNQTLIYFGEDQDASLSNFFIPISEFVIKFDRLVNERTSVQTLNQFIQLQQNKGVMDALIQSIKSGTTFKD
ncbi:protein diaphanous [Anaeramoeba flamelloides]|uniref:Protein diaphanous n=1 Tax=Anaeramoeba flamelloides TaxID=1746091 RepID=A0AAV7Z6N8_9EUKA|nr:protein diaphanous [Anaeramoeba flamelloides]